MTQRRMRSKIPVLEQALTAIVHAHHRQLLAMQLAHIAFLDEQLEALTRALAVSLSVLSSTAPASEERPPLLRPRPVSPPGASPTLTLTRAVELFDTIPGIDQRGAEGIVAEIGVARSRFATAPRLAAWAGVAPGHEARAGTQRSGQTRQGNRPLRAILTPLAPAAVRTKGTYRSAWYQRLAARRGKHRAILAVAHASIRSAFYRLSRQGPYRA
jgi:transposase